MNELFDLTGKVAVVTGGTRGIGKEIAKGFARAKANVVVIGTSVNEDLVKEIESFGVKCKGYKFNLQEFDKYQELVDDIVKEMGTIDILVNNAGVQKRHPSVEFPKEDWDFVLDINCNAPFFMCQKVGKVMIEKGYGKIINLASLLSFQGGLTVPAYAASKGAVSTFTKSLSNEWASKGININCIAPGYIDTEMNTALISNETRNRQILERIPAARWGKPSDLVGTALFLASPASDYINGFTIAVDGGWLGR